MSRLTDRLKSFRAKHKLTLEDMARLIGVSLSTFNKWLAEDSVPTKRSLEQIESNMKKAMLDKIKR